MRDVVHHLPYVSLFSILHSPLGFVVLLFCCFVVYSPPYKQRHSCRLDTDFVFRGEGRGTGGALPAFRLSLLFYFPCRADFLFGSLFHVQQTKRGIDHRVNIKTFSVW